MAAARLSPAANLLRNSKLFALPPAIALPVPEPSSEPVPRSDTATTSYPTRAAIETPLTSLGRGDWGFKRPLPLKSTTKTGSPTVRLNKGIDTAEHIADFDSAADHVLTLKKFQELNQSIEFPTRRRDRGKVHFGAFRKSHDNTTNVSPSAPGHSQYSGAWPSLSPAALRESMPEELRSQLNEAPVDASASPAQAAPKPKQNSTPLRWRYDGPSLVQMSGFEFDQWLKSLDSAKVQAFREAVKNDLLFKKRNTHAAKAQDAGTVGEVDVATLRVSNQEVENHLRKLRHQPREFGRLIAEFLDLPEGPTGQGVRLRLQDIWHYGRHTIASDIYEESGPPRTHPSAGLSYIQNPRWASNHILFGPQDARLPVIARQVRTRARGPNNVASLGVAGFIVAKEAHKGTIQQTTTAFEPQPGGQKTVVKLDKAEIDEKGALNLTVKGATEYQVEEERPVHQSMISDARVAALRPTWGAGSRVMQPLTRTRTVDYKKREDLFSGSTPEDFDFLGKTK